MESNGQVSSSSDDKPTVVRVKRKRDDAPIESLWLEVTGRPIKRHTLNINSLSLSDTTDHLPDETAPTKLLFRRVETLSPSGIKDLSLPQLLQKAKGIKKPRERPFLENRLTKNSKDKHGQLLAAAKDQHEEIARTARFEQVWRSRRREEKAVEEEREDEEDAIRELFHLYDVVRVDVEKDSAEKASRREKAKREAELTEGQLLCNYLPLLREYLPDLASEIDASAQCIPIDTKTEEFVYDVYTLDEDMVENNEGSEAAYPTIQVMDGHKYDWREPKDPDYDSEDSNDENNPNNDYPEEENEYADQGLHDDSSSDNSEDLNPYSQDKEEYDTVLSDEEKEVWRPRK